MTDGDLLTLEQQIGLDGEDYVIENDANLGLVPESTGWRADAVVVRDAPYGDRGTPVEVKVCVVWKQDGESRRAGEWMVREDQHDWLLEHGGVYALSVYLKGDDDRPDVWKGLVYVPAEEFESHIKTWWDYKPQTRATNVPWTRVIDRDTF